MEYLQNRLLSSLGKHKNIQKFVVFIIHGL